MSRFSLLKSPLWRGFWYPEDEQVGDDDRRGEKVEGSQQAMAVCDQPGEQGPQCAADGLGAEQRSEERRVGKEWWSLGSPTPETRRTLTEATEVAGCDEYVDKCVCEVISV